MREDMFKVIVERPRQRSTKRVLASVIRLRDDLDGPARLGMRMGYDYRDLNENLVPLRRYLEAQVGRPWSKVFGEICERIDRRNTPYSWAPWTIHQELYVDPDTGLVRRNKGAGNWRRSYKQRLQAEQAEIHARRRVISADTQLLLVAGLWFEVVVEKLPEAIVTHAIVKGRLSRRELRDHGLSSSQVKERQ